MNKLKRLEVQLKKYQERHQKLLKSDKAASSRYGNEELTMQLRVLESAVAQIEKEIKSLRKG